MTISVDSEGAAFSTMSCFRCEQAGPHWSSRHGRAGTFVCRRCFATFSDEEPAAMVGGVLSHSPATAEELRFFESK
ncbi:hypothetical protein QEH68_09040 [Paenarthrobacter sp. OM7]|uniref:hypothetical protein n=1 Tax=Paenarthrobacter sp. OM7 TaxID=3041264 RepID=UPI0024688AC5|nr:hypothetical protein [Paenarthrobacter sp. OM7]WGM22298.1 hypothetical protein QEH68_09040 [Paenarthrobacter sp. OM7]